MERSTPVGPRFGSRRASWVVAIISLTAFAVAWRSSVSEPVLLNRSTRVCAASGWMIDRGPDACRAWGWLSDHELLHLETFGMGVRFVRLETRTGAVQTLDRLTKAFAASKGDPDGVQVSPDGRWILWEGSDPRSHRGHTLVAELDDSHAFQPSLVDSRGFARWLGDSAHVVDLSPDVASAAGGPGQAAVDVFTVASPLQAQRLPVQGRPGQTNPRQKGPSAPSNTVAWRGSAYGGHQLAAPAGSRGDRFLTTSWAGGRANQRSIDVYEVSTTGRIAERRLHSIPVSAGATIENLLISPQGDRIAWHLSRPSRPPLPAFVYHLVPSMRPTPSDRTELVVSGIDGSKMRLICSLTRSAGLQPDPDIEELRWLPGGKRLSFFYRDGLYTVPVD